MSVGAYVNSTVKSGTNLNPGIYVYKCSHSRLELETKLQENERRRIDEETHRHAEREKYDERVRQAHEAKETAEKEALVFK